MIRSSLDRAWEARDASRVFPQPGLSRWRQSRVHRALALLAALLLGLMLTGAPAAAQNFPPIAGPVTDPSHALTPAEDAALSAKLAQIRATTGREVVVAVIPSLEGYDIADYGYRLGRTWGIGKKGEDMGALLIVAPNDRRVRIEVGYGLEPILTDAMSSLIINQQIVPHFHDGDLYGGIDAGVDAIGKVLALPPDEARAMSEKLAKDQKSGGGSAIGWALFGVVILVFFVLPLMRSRKGARARQYGGRASPWGNAARDVILWEIAKGAASALTNRDDDDDSGGWGGGFGGGSWGGGGGGFGGGGASGSW